MNIKTGLRNQLSQSKTKVVIQELINLTHSEGDLHEQALALSTRYQNYLHERHGATSSDENLNLELNRINAAVFDLIDRVPDNAKPPANKRGWAKIAFVLSIVATIATITGYTIKDFFHRSKPQPPAFQPHETQDAPNSKQVFQSKEKPEQIIQPQKNNVEVEVNDNGKVGNIITGDSNKIDIKQEF